MKKGLFTLLFLCATVLNVTAQQPATIKSFVQTTDHISGADRRVDANGVPCALVKVQVVDDIERVEGNKIGNIINKGVEKWVYMCRGSRNMRIHLKNFLPVKVMFQDYKINGLESNRVYELVLSLPKPVVTEEPKTQMGLLRLEGIPSNAEVTISSEQMKPKVYGAQEDGRLELSLPYGRYNYLVKAVGYYDANGSVFVSDEGLWERVPITLITGTVNVSCLTKGVDFYINGEWVNNKPFVKELAPGQYFVEARKKKLTQGQMVTVTPGQTITVQLPVVGRASVAAQSLGTSETAETDMQKNILYTFNLRPKSASLKINGETLFPGTSGIVGVNLTPGKYAYTVEAQGYESKSDSITVKVRRSGIGNYTMVKLNKVSQPKPVVQKEIEEDTASGKSVSVVSKSSSAVKSKSTFKSPKDEKSVVFGIRGGVNLASLTVSDNGRDGSCSMKTSFHAGLSADIAMSSKLHLNTGLFYSQKGYEYEGYYYSSYYGTMTETVTADFIMLPVQLSLRLGRFQINAGPYIEYGIGGTIETIATEKDTFEYYDAVNYGLTLGVGITLGKRFYIGANQEMGLSDYANRTTAISLGVNF